MCMPVLVLLVPLRLPAFWDLLYTCGQMPVSLILDAGPPCIPFETLVPLLLFETPVSQILDACPPFAIRDAGLADIGRLFPFAIRDAGLADIGRLSPFCYSRRRSR